MHQLPPAVLSSEVCLAKKRTAAASSPDCTLHRSLKVAPYKVWQLSNIMHVCLCCCCCLSLRLHHDDLKVPEYLARTAIKLGMWKFVQVSDLYAVSCAHHAAQCLLRQHAYCSQGAAHCFNVVLYTVALELVHTCNGLAVLAP